jgi:hypothetical protein
VREVERLRETPRNSSQARSASIVPSRFSRASMPSPSSSSNTRNGEPSSAWPRSRISTMLELRTRPLAFASLKKRCSDDRVLRHLGAHDLERDVAVDELVLRGPNGAARPSSERRKRRYRDWMSSPACTLHHKANKYNFGQFFTVCDRLWGTYKAPLDLVYDGAYPSPVEAGKRAAKPAASEAVANVGAP